MPLQYNEGNKPHFSAVAVGGIRDDQIVWILTDYRDERCQPPKQQFKLPGGTAEMFDGHWESPVETAVRELSNEIGVRRVADELVEVACFEAGVNHRHHYFLAWFGDTVPVIKEYHHEDAGEHLEFSWQTTEVVISMLTTRHLKGFERVLWDLAKKLGAEAMLERDASKAKLVLKMVEHHRMALARIKELDRLEDERQSQRRAKQGGGKRQ